MRLPEISRTRLAELELIDAVCDSFESCWRERKAASLEEAVAQASGIAARRELFRELLLIEINYRRMHGNSPIPGEYLGRFPDWKVDIADVFALYSTNGYGSDESVNITSRPSCNSQFLGRFELMEELGRGASGVVYRARDPLLDRDVALKVSHWTFLNGMDQRRISREARNIGRLSHPGVVPVYEVGRSGQDFFIAMELVTGPTLAQAIIGEGPFDPCSASRLVIQLADALHHAHERGVIHRDLKPSNILLAPAPAPVPAAASSLDWFVPRIADFGLALCTDGASTPSTGSVVGTPAYMSPEQAQGRSRLADARSDVYSLGVVLYQLLAGRVPFEGDVASIVRRIGQDDVPDIRSFQPAVPKGLAAICHKCLRISPDHRYQSAAHLKADLAAWLEFRPIQARHYSPAARALNRARRRPALFALSAVLLVVLVVAASLVSWQAAATSAARRRASAVLVSRLVSASQAELRQALQAVRAELPEIEGVIREELGIHTGNLRDRLRLSLALLPADPSLAAAPWVDMLLEAGPVEMALLLDSGIMQPDVARPKLWAIAKSTSSDVASGRKLRAMVALAHLDPDHSAWDACSGELLQHLFAPNLTDRAAWARLARPLADRFESRLQQDISRVGSDASAGIVAAALFAGKPDALSRLLLTANGRHYEALLDAIGPHAAVVCDHLSSVVANDVHGTSDSAGDEMLVQQRAKALVTLLRLDRRTDLWSHLQHSEDPRLQTYVIHYANQMHMPIDRLVRAIVEQSDPGALYTAMLSLARYSPFVARSNLERDLVARLLELYEHHPDPGVHGAADQLLRRLGQAEELAEINHRLVAAGISWKRRWFIDPSGICFVVVKGPVRFLAGSPRDEAGRDASEAHSVQTITAPVAISTTEFSYRNARAAGLTWQRDEFRSPSEDCPVVGISLLDAIDACNLLTKRYLGDGDQVFQYVDSKWQCHVTRFGYRLPTDLEWEFVCRAGTRTSRFFGSRYTTLAISYAWYTSEDRFALCGDRLPNQFGMFDLYGNASEWVLGEFRAPWQPVGSLLVDGETLAIHRGGANGSKDSHYRSAWRIPTVAKARVSVIGFRLARTLDLGGDDTQ